MVRHLWSLLDRLAITSTITNQSIQLEQLLREMLLGGIFDAGTNESCHTFDRLKVLYEDQGIWEEKEEPLWDEIAIAYSEYWYARILAEQCKLPRLMDVLRNSQDPHNIYKYAGLVAKAYPEEVQKMYIKQYMEDAEHFKFQESFKTQKHRSFLNKIKKYKEIFGKAEALKFLNSLIQGYQQYPEMRHEFELLQADFIKD